MKKTLLTIFILFLLQKSSLSQDFTKLFELLNATLEKNDSLILSDIQTGNILYSFNSNRIAIPASTIKVPSSLFAVETLGENFRFDTEFYIDKNNNLLIRGKGDPYLVSEEIKVIVKNLISKLDELHVEEINNIIIDDSFFDKIIVPGVENSENPYDVMNGALVVNFNTVALMKKKGEVISADSRTPITELAKKIGQKIIKKRAARINISYSYHNVIQYDCELFREFLKKYSFKVNGECEYSDNLHGFNMIYDHYSSKSLIDLVKVLLKFSNNFIANQIFLRAGIEKYGPPGNLEKSVRAMSEFYRKTGWKEFTFVEGSGIAYENNIMPLDMLKLLNSPRWLKLRPLLKEDRKSGTLKGAMSFAGYVGDYSFVLYCHKADNDGKWTLYLRRAKIYAALKEYLKKKLVF